MIKTIHIHVWKDGKHDPADLDAECTGMYTDPTGEPDELDHLQFGCTLPNGDGLELRLPLSWLTEEAKLELTKD